MDWIKTVDFDHRDVAAAWAVCNEMHEKARVAVANFHAVREIMGPPEAAQSDEYLQAMHLATGGQAVMSAILARHLGAQ